MPGNGHLFYWGMGLFSFGLYQFIIAIKCRRKKHLYEHLPLSKIRSLAMGLAEVHGIVVPSSEETLISPFSGVECVFYSAKIEEQKNNVKYISWNTLGKNEDGVGFYLKDHTGTVRIDLNGADFELSSQKEFFTNQEELPEGMYSRLEEYNSSLIENCLKGDRVIRFKEKVIKPKEFLHVIGTVKDNPEVENTTGQKIPMI